MTQTRFQPAHAPRSIPPGLTPLPRVIAALATMLALLLLPAPPAIARAPGPEPLSLDVTFGWPNELNPRNTMGTVIVPERWCPAAIRITGEGGQPLAEPFDGVVTFEYVQDATQRARVSVRVAGTPGRVIASQAVLCVPRAAMDVRVTLTDQAGRLRGQVDYTSQMRNDRDRPLPEVLTLDALGLLSVGLPKPVPDTVLAALRPRDTNGWDYQRRYFSGRLDAGALPPSPAAYASLSALVVNASEAIDARTKGAIREWVLGGGRLLLVADQPGGDWRSWLPPGPAGDLIGIADPATASLPEDLVALAGEPLPLPVVERTRRREAGGTDLANATKPTAPEQPVRSRGVRAIRLTDTGIADGWTTQWDLGRNADGASSEGALLASGPVGLGMVCVVGVDPARTNAAQSTEAADRVWDHALRPLLGDLPEPGRTEDGQPVYAGDWYISSGESVSGCAAILSAMNLVGDEAPVDGLIIVVSTVCMCGLALMLGPGDFILLRARRRHFSWLSAMGWIALACGGAYLGPALLRSSDSRVQRVSSVDIVEPPHAAADAEPAPAPLAIDSSLTVFWAGRTSGVSVLDANGVPTALGATDGRFWRGASALPLMRYDQPGLLMPTLSFAQRPGSIDATRDGWGGIAPAQAGCTAPLPGGLDLRRWTLRATLDAGRGAPLVRARAVPGLTPPEFEISGIPAGARVGLAAVRLGATPADWYTGVMAQEPETSRRGTQTVRLRVQHDARAAELFEPEANAQHHLGQYYGTHPAFVPGHALHLPGVPARGLAIQRRLASGRWAALYLELDNLELGVRLDAEGRLSRRAVVRVLVPLPPP